MDVTVELTDSPNVSRQTSYRALTRSAVISPAVPSTSAAAGDPQVPAYLWETYYWAYLNPRNVRLLDRELVVSVILWGNHRRLRQSAFAELLPGQKVLQPACVYGDFSPALARHLGLLGAPGYLSTSRPFKWPAVGVSYANSHRQRLGAPTLRSPVANSTMRCAVTSCCTSFPRTTSARSLTHCLGASFRAARSSSSITTGRTGPIL